MGPKWKPDFTTYIPSSRSKAIEEAKGLHTGVRVYSDRLGVEGGVGAVVVLYRSGIEKRLMQMYLGTEDEHMV